MFSLSLSDSLVFSLPFVAQSIGAFWWGSDTGPGRSASQVGLNLTRLLGANPRLWGFVTPSPQTAIPASHGHLGLSYSGNYSQDPSPATRWCLGSGPALSFSAAPACRLHPGWGPQGQDQGSGHSTGARRRGELQNICSNLC